MLVPLYLFLHLLVRSQASPSENDIFVIGGYSSANQPQKSAETYSFDTTLWSNIADLSVKRTGLGAASINGLLYAVGGVGASRTLEVFDPSANAWVTLSPTMSVGRDYLGVTAYDGQIYAVGGKNGSSVLSTIEAFDVKESRWSLLSGMQSARAYLGVGFLGGYLYAVGGRNQSRTLNSVERYDPTTDRWSVVRPMMSARESHCVAVVDDMLFAIGGKGLRTVEAYDAELDTWMFVANMSADRYGAGAVSVNGLIYVVGGMSKSDGAYFDSVEVYNPETNGWSHLPARLSTSRHYAGVTNLTAQTYPPGTMMTRSSQSTRITKQAKTTPPAKKTTPQAKSSPLSSRTGGSAEIRRQTSELFFIMAAVLSWCYFIGI